MTAAATLTPSAPAPAGSAAAGGGPLTGTGTLVRFILRRDRIRIPAWLAALTVVQVGGAASYPDLYPTGADRQNQASVVGDNPAMRAMTGPGHGLADYTYGAMMTNEYLGFMVIFGALMSVLMVVRHTRAEEEAGRAELVRASVVGRYAPLSAALVSVALTNLALGLLIALGMGGLGIESMDWTGSFLFGAAFAVVGLVFAGVVAVTVQLSAYARTAAGLAGALIGVAYGLRAIGDVGGNLLSWLSPIGWAQAVAPYVDDNPAPLGLALVVTALLVVVAFALGDRRDTGAGLRPGRAGAATAAAWLGTPFGFAWRLQRASFFWWAFALFGFGLGYGSAVDVIEDYADNEVVQEMVENIGGATLTESWLSMVIGLLAIVCTIFAIITAMRPRREETSGRGELVLATAVSRTRWVATHVVIAMLGGAGMLLVTGLGLGLAASGVSGDADLLWQVLAATLAYAPAVWLTTGLAVTGFGLVPRAIGLAWALLAYAVLVVYLGGLLQLPQWLLDLSPFTHIPRMPAAGFTALPLVVLTGLAAGLVAVGLAGWRRRDIESV